jgi:hypothetical protein
MRLGHFVLSGLVRLRSPHSVVLDYNTMSRVKDYFGAGRSGARQEGLKALLCTLSGMMEGLADDLGTGESGRG